MKPIFKLLIPSILGVSDYLITQKLFPEEVKNFDKNPMTAVRGGNNESKLFKRVFRAIIKDKTLKIALVVGFGTAGWTYFQNEAVALLADDTFNPLCVKDTSGNLEIVCDIVEKYDFRYRRLSVNIRSIISSFSRRKNIRSKIYPISQSFSQALFRKNNTY